MNERRRDFDHERFTQALHDRASGRGAMMDTYRMPYRSASTERTEYDRRWSMLVDWVRAGLDDAAIAAKWSLMPMADINLIETLRWARSIERRRFRAGGNTDTYKQGKKQ
jgi:hypothetical protein